MWLDLIDLISTSANTMPIFESKMKWNVLGKLFEQICHINVLSLYYHFDAEKIKSKGSDFFISIRMSNFNNFIHLDGANVQYVQNIDGKYLHLVSLLGKRLLPLWTA